MNLPITNLKNYIWKTITFSSPQFFLSSFLRSWHVDMFSLLVSSSSSSPINPQTLICSSNKPLPSISLLPHLLHFLSCLRRRCHRQCPSRHPLSHNHITPHTPLWQLLHIHLHCLMLRGRKWRTMTCRATPSYPSSMLDVGFFVIFFLWVADFRRWIVHYDFCEGQDKLDLCWCCLLVHQVNFLLVF